MSDPSALEELLSDEPKAERRLWHPFATGVRAVWADMQKVGALATALTAMVGALTALLSWCSPSLIHPTNQNGSDHSDAARAEVEAAKMRKSADDAAVRLADKINERLTTASQSSTVPPPPAPELTAPKQDRTLEKAPVGDVAAQQPRIETSSVQDGPSLVPPVKSKASPPPSNDNSINLTATLASPLPPAASSSANPTDESHPKRLFVVASGGSNTDRKVADDLSDALSSAHFDLAPDLSAATVVIDVVDQTADPPTREFNGHVIWKTTAHVKVRATRSSDGAVLFEGEFEAPGQVDASKISDAVTSVAAEARRHAVDAAVKHFQLTWQQ